MSTVILFLHGGGRQSRHPVREAVGGHVRGTSLPLHISSYPPCFQTCNKLPPGVCTPSGSAFPLSICPLISHSLCVAEPQSIVCLEKVSNSYAIQRSAPPSKGWVLGYQISGPHNFSSPVSAILPENWVVGQCPYRPPHPLWRPLVR